MMEAWLLKGDVCLDMDVNWECEQRHPDQGKKKDPRILIPG